MEINMVLPASYAGYADEDYGINIPTVEDYKKLGKFAAETFTPYGDIQTGKDAYNAYQQGEYLKALANAGLIGLGYTPFGLVARPIGRLGKRALNAAVDPDYRSLGDILGNPASMPYRGVGADVGPLSNPEIRKILEEKKRLQKEYGDDTQINFHTSMAEELDPNTFRYKSINVPGKAGTGEGPMIFTHGLLDTEAFKPFGSNVHAVISDKKGRTFGGKMDTEDPRYEIAIPEKDVIDIIRVLKREK
jgi:hypothetical protein|tara:strand:- start:46 stop:786 length:741 start_codon:yes stop_codon:yes gene_type:complete